jgi:hypothetical protein
MSASDMLDRIDLSGIQPSVDSVTWNDCVVGFKQADNDMGSAFHRKIHWMNTAAEIYLLDKDKMAGFIEKFAVDCGISYPYGKRLNRIRKVPYTVQNFGHDAIEALLAAPEELRDDIVSYDKPVTVTEVQEAKKGYKEVQEDPDYVDLLEDVKDNRKSPTEAAKEALIRSEKKREAISNTVSPDVIDLGAIARNKEGTDIRSVGPAFIVLMEKLCTKFDERDIKRELYAFMEPDPLGLKKEAMHKMSDILSDLCLDFPLNELKNLN